MKTLTVRNLSEDVHRRMKAAAAEKNMSAEAFVRDLLDRATRPGRPLGDPIARRAAELEVDYPPLARRKEPVEAADFH